jgi:hypothetical protein
MIVAVDLAILDDPSHFLSVQRQAVGLTFFAFL